MFLLLQRHILYYEHEECNALAVSDQWAKLTALIPDDALYSEKEGIWVQLDTNLQKRWYEIRPIRFV